MIAQLRGILIHKSPEYSIVDVSGVGYRVFTPFSTFYDLAVVYAVNDVIYGNPVFKSFCEGMIYDVKISGLNLLSDS